MYTFCFAALYCVKMLFLQAFRFDKGYLQQTIILIRSSFGYSFILCFRHLFLGENMDSYIPKFENRTQKRI